MQLSGFLSDNILCLLSYSEKYAKIIRNSVALNLYGVQSNYPPLAVFVYEYPLVGAVVTGYSFVYLQGTDPSNGKLVPVLGGVPLATGAYPTVLLTESAAGGIQFQAEFALGS